MNSPEKSGAQNSPPNPLPLAVLHHIGYVVRSIAEVGEEFAGSIGATWDGVIVNDPLQMAKVTFMNQGGGSNPSFELVEPADDKSPLNRFLARGGGLHHVCYEVDSLHAQLQHSRAAGCLIVKQPLPAVAFGGRKIAWVYSPHKLLLEYLER